MTTSKWWAASNCEKQDLLRAAIERIIAGWGMKNRTQFQTLWFLSSPWRIETSLDSEDGAAV